MIHIEKNVYDPPEKKDGIRILVMSLWPRGIAKTRVDRWLKELGTPKELIHQWKNGKISWTELARGYTKILKNHSDLLQALAKESKKNTLTLLCSCKDPEHCHRSLLKKAIEAYL